MSNDERIDVPIEVRGLVIKDLQPTDHIVLRFPPGRRAISEAAARRLYASVRAALPTDNKILILRDGIEIDVVRPVAELPSFQYVQGQRYPFRFDTLMSAISE